MYKRVLLAYDGSVESAVSLREGALLAKRCGARIFILAVVPETVSVRLADGLHGEAITQQTNNRKALLERGVSRLEQLGLKPVARLVVGEPVREIARFAREVSADLVVVSHRKRSMLERWWAGATGSFISDRLSCSLLIARNIVSDESFDVELRTRGGSV